jgi:outer membrane lipoprotein SlyB
MEIPAGRSVFRIFPWLFAAFLLMFSTSCANVNLDELSKTAKGTIAGAATGAIAGGLATGNVRGALVGAVIGGIIGNRIGAYLDEQDQEELQKLHTKALQNGKEQSFVTRKTGDQLTITPGAIEPGIETYELAEGVQERGLIPADEVSIDAYVNTPVYSDTNTKKAPRYVLKQGGKLYVPMHVASKSKTGSGWGAVVDKSLIGGNQVVGYVQTSYLNPKTARAYQPPVKKVVKKKTEPVKKTGTVTAKTDKAPQPSPAPQAQAAAKESQEVVSSPASQMQAVAKESPEAASPMPQTQTVVKESQEAPVSQPPKQEEEAGIILVSEAPKSVAAAKPVELNLKCRTTRIKIKDVMEEQKFCEKPPPKWVKV